jgi:hypothetical protein
LDENGKIKIVSNEYSIFYYLGSWDEDGKRTGDGFCVLPGGSIFAYWKNDFPLYGYLQRTHKDDGIYRKFMYINKTITENTSENPKNIKYKGTTKGWFDKYDNIIDNKIVMTREIVDILLQNYENKMA